MQLSREDLTQLDEAYLRRLGEGSLRSLSVKLLADLKEAPECLGQDPSNSSRPPSSRAPWEQAQAEDTASESAPEERERADEEPPRLVSGTSPESAPTEKTFPAPAGQRPGAPGPAERETP